MFKFLLVALSTVFLMSSNVTNANPYHHFQNEHYSEQGMHHGGMYGYGYGRNRVGHGYMMGGMRWCQGNGYGRNNMPRGFDVNSNEFSD